MEGIRYEQNTNRISLSLNSYTNNKINIFKVKKEKIMLNVK